jgi:hypothetical protein
MAANSDVGLSHFYRLQTQALHRIQESSPEEPRARGAQEQTDGIGRPRKLLRGLVTDA